LFIFLYKYVDEYDKISKNDPFYIVELFKNELNKLNIHIPNIA